MNLFSLIILSNTNSKDIYVMNNNCISSFIVSANLALVAFEIILVESNPIADYNYDFKKLHIIKPNGKFNFHKFANIGLKQASGNYYVFSNNDVVFDESFLLEILKVSQQNPKIKSFSPYDVSANSLPKEVIANQDFVLGFDIQKHLTGWCIVMCQSVYKTIKQLDERFGFYYADNDYAMQLQKHHIKHALITKAKAKHLVGRSVSKSHRKSELPKGIPKYVIKENRIWILNNPAMIEGLIIFHKKWGSQKLIKLKLLLASYSSKLGLGLLNKYIVFNK